MRVEPVIIIGAGPAGLATAVQLKRYGITPLIFERAKAGGLLWNANLVENYPGFPNGITGPQLVRKFIRQASNLGITVISERVVDLAYTGGSYQVRTDQDSYTSRIVVIATGTRPLRLRELPVPVEISRQVFYEVIDLIRVQGKHIVIIGAGDAAFDYALNLGRSNRVSILNRGGSPNCLPLLWERTRHNPGIAYIDNTSASCLSKVGKSGILVDCQGKAGALQFEADYLVIAIGREPQLDCLTQAFLQQAGSLDEQGSLHWIGDAKNGIFRQTSIAVGDGVMVAMKIYRYLKELA